jgi:hypothetical protein
MVGVGAVGTGGEVVPGPLLDVIVDDGVVLSGPTPD